MTRLEQLKSLSLELHEQRDELKAKVAEIDTLLKQYNLGITCWVPVPNEQETHFGYMKHNRQWGLAIKRNDETWPFNDAPSKLRVLSIPLLDALLDKLILQTAVFVAMAGRANQQAAVFKRALLEEGLDKV